VIEGEMQRRVRRYETPCTLKPSITLLPPPPVVAPASDLRVSGSKRCASVCISRVCYAIRFVSRT